MAENKDDKNDTDSKKDSERPAPKEPNVTPPMMEEPLTDDSEDNLSGGGLFEVSGRGKRVRIE